MSNIKFRHTLRANKQYSKVYIENRLQEFGNLWARRYDNISTIDFAKQDMRGCLSICVFDSRHCVPANGQKFFLNQHELMAFVNGYLEAKSE